MYSIFHAGRCGISKLHRATALIQKRFVAHHLKEHQRPADLPVAEQHPSVVAFMADKNNKPETRQRSKAMEAVEEMFDRYHKIAKMTKANYYDRHVMETAKIITANTADEKSLASAEFILPIDSTYTNVNDVMHGGAYAVIFDMLTTAALAPISEKHYWEFLGGVTRSLNISYLMAVPIGKTIRIRSEVMQAGKKMALIRGTMLSMDEGTAYATCEHHKVNIPMRREHAEIVTSLGRRPEEDAKFFEEDSGPTVTYQASKPGTPERIRLRESRAVRERKWGEEEQLVPKRVAEMRRLADRQVEQAIARSNAKL